MGPPEGKPWMSWLLPPRAAGTGWGSDGLQSFAALWCHRGHWMDQALPAAPSLRLKPPHHGALCLYTQCKCAIKAPRGFPQPWSQFHSFLQQLVYVRAVEKIHIGPSASPWWRGEPGGLTKLCSLHSTEGPLLQCRQEERELTAGNAAAGSKEGT